MDSWNIPGGMSSVLSGAASSVLLSRYQLDPFYIKVLASQKTLLQEVANQVPLTIGEALDADPSAALTPMTPQISRFILAACANDIGVLEDIILQSSDVINNVSKTGITPLIYAIFFHQPSTIEWLLENGANVDETDTALSKYTPLMWAVHLDQLDTVKLLFNYQADPYLTPNGTKKSAVSLVSPENNLMYAYFQTHNLLEKLHAQIDENDSFFKDSPSNTNDFNDTFDDTVNKIRLQAVTASHYEEEDESETSKAQAFVDEQRLASDPYLKALPDFDYLKLEKDQYLKFADSDIPSLLDFIFGIRLLASNTLQHDTKIPAAVLFQLLRYSSIKAESKELTEFLFDCFSVRLRKITNTTSGVIFGNENEGEGDIVLLSYWISVLQFLHFYMMKGSFYKSYPTFLQELINLLHSLIATLAFSINSRLNDIVDSCILDFESLVDVSNVLYAKDWNLFKSKKKHPNTYDDIYNMLFPPTQKDLMKPSPVKYIQVLGALDYVLKLHEVNMLLQFQIFSHVFYGLNCTIFNRVISQSKYCSRSKAIQIRLNLSTLEDWLRSHNYKIAKPESIGGLQSYLPEDSPALTNLLLEGGRDSNTAKIESKDPHVLSFYYNSLYHIGKTQLQPTIELLEWLQCMSHISGEKDLEATIDVFEYLNYFQFVKTMSKLYKYEVDEKKIPKPLVNHMKQLQNEFGEAQVSKNNLHYMTQVNFLLKEVYIYLNPNFVFPVALPNMSELINLYGSGLGGVRIYRARKYQPSLPMSVMDDVDELLTKNKEDQNRTYQEDDDDEDDNDENDDYQEHYNRGDGEDNILSGTQHLSLDESRKPELHFKGDQMFKELQAPSSLVHKNWGDDDIEANPW